MPVFVIQLTPSFLELHQRSGAALVMSINPFSLANFELGLRRTAHLSKTSNPDTNVC